MSKKIAKRNISPIFTKASHSKKPCTKRYQNRPRFIKGITKHFGMFFSSQF